MKLLSGFSYTGSVGKTLILTGIAYNLYKRNYNVAIMDFNLVSPCSLTLLFNKLDVMDGIESVLYADEKINNVIIDVSDKGSRSRIYIIPAVLDAKKIFKVLKNGYPYDKIREVISNIEEDLDIDILVIDTPPGFMEDTIIINTFSNLVIIVLKYNFRDFLGARLASAIFERLGVPNISIVNMVPADQDISKVKEYIESKFNIRPSIVIPFYIEISEYMVGRSIKNVLINSIGFKRDIDKLTDIVEVKLFYG